MDKILGTTSGKIIKRQVRTTSRDFTQGWINRKNIYKLIASLLIVIITLPILLYAHITSLYANDIKSTIEEVPRHRVAIVFGASVWEDGPSPILKERLDAAIDLYKAQKVTKILVSGDNRELNYNEPVTMMEYLVEQGIAEKDVTIDYAGVRTYDTCHRAKNIFRVNEAVLVTQKFHLYRALYLCNALGVESVGYSADKGDIDITEWLIRDFFALTLAVWEVNFDPPKVTGGEIIPIE